MFQATATNRTPEPTLRISRPDSHVTAVQRACRYIEARVDGTDCADGRDETAVVTLAELGEHCGLSPGICSDCSSGRWASAPASMATRIA